MEGRKDVLEEDVDRELGNGKSDSALYPFNSIGFQAAFERVGTVRLSHSLSEDLCSEKRSSVPNA